MKYMINIEKGSIFEYDEAQVMAKRYMVECDKDGVITDAPPQGHIVHSSQNRMGLEPELLRLDMDADRVPELNGIGASIDKKIKQLQLTGKSVKSLLPAPKRKRKNRRRKR